MDCLKNSNLKENKLGVHDTLKHGFVNVRSELSTVNSLKIQENNLSKLDEDNFFYSAKISQGLYASFIKQMETKFSMKINRLPLLKSSKLMCSILNGSDETINVENIFNNQREFCEYNYNLDSATD